MQKHPVRTLLLFAFAAASGCAGNRPSSASQANSYNPPQVGIAPARGAKPVSDELSAPDPTAPANWHVLAVLTYDQRLQFYGGFPFVLAAVDKQIADLAAKRSPLRSILEKLTWNPAMKELRAARENFNNAGSKMSATDMHDWDEKMQLAGEAWQRTQDAVKKVRATVGK